MDASLGVGSAANLVGGSMQSIAAQQAARAMRAEYKKEIDRQSGYRNQAYDAFQGGLRTRGVEQAREDIAKGAEHRRGNYAEAGVTPLSVSGSGPGARDLSQYDLMGTLRAQLGGYSDWGLENMIRNIRTQDKLNQISNFAGGTAEVYPYRAYDAQHSQDELAAWGNLISSIGGGAQGWGELLGTGPKTQQRPMYGLGGYGPDDYGIPWN